MERPWNSACAVWDFTFYGLGVEEKILDKDGFIVWLSRVAKKWCFQLEKCPSTGSLHFQGRLSLKVKQRVGWWLKDAAVVGGIHLSVTSSENRDNMFYVMKDDTRVDGPWKDDDEVVFISEEALEMDKILSGTPDKRWFFEIRDWMRREDKDGRQIRLILDPIGGHMKTMFATWATMHGYAQRICVLPSHTSGQIMAQILKMKKYGCYIFDFPRAIDKRKMDDIMCAIEEVKNGHAFDHRYRFVEEYFPRPDVLLFMNDCPRLNAMSQDRWFIQFINFKWRLKRWYEGIWDEEDKKE